MKKVLGAAVGAAILAGAAGGAQGAETLVFSTWVPPTHSLNAYGFFPWFKEVEKATKGAVKFRTLPKPIGRPNQHYDAVVRGQIDLSYATYGYQPERFMPYLIAELPQLGDTAVDNGVALWRIHKKYYTNLPIHKDVHLIGVMTHGPGMMHHSKHPILVPADLKGQKIRVGGDVPKAIVEHFGGVVITQPAPKSYEILSQGIADGIFFPAESLKGFNIIKLVPYTTYVKGGLYSSSFWFAMNKRKWEKLPASVKAVFNKMGGEAFARYMGKNSWDRADRESMEAAKKAGNTFQEASPAFVKELSKVTAQLETRYAAELDKMGLPGRKVIADFRAEVKKVAAGH
jgi:TRAP-type C4-dicarboxylate transport system substrate-binding protein